MEPPAAPLIQKESLSGEFSELKDKMNIIKRSNKDRIESTPPIMMFVRENLVLVGILIILVLLLIYYFLGVVFNIFFFIFS